MADLTLQTRDEFRRLCSLNAPRRTLYLERRLQRTPTAQEASEFEQNFFSAVQSHNVAVSATRHESHIRLPSPHNS